MINNQVGRDERVHLSEHDVIFNDNSQAGASTDPPTDDPDRMYWPQTKSDRLLQDVQGSEKRKTMWKKIKGAVFPIIVLGIILGLIVMLFVINGTSSDDPDEVKVTYHCEKTCSVSLVESIPENLTYPSGSPSHPSTYSMWKKLISEANSSLHISSMYWTLRSSELSPPGDYPSTEGEDIFRLLKDAVKRGITVQIAEDVGFGSHIETDILKQLGAEVRNLNFTHLTGSGVLHTKFIIADLKSFYVGSANMDWRALSQVKEMGVYISDCDCPIVDDLYKVFKVYWKLYGNSAVVPEPDKWPADYVSNYNSTHPLLMELSGKQQAHVYISGSPDKITPTGRSIDIDTILAVMDSAREFVHVAVMDYFPTTLYAPNNNNKYWPDIDNKIRQLAFERNIKVKLLGSFWNHTDQDMLGYLKSLDSFSDNIEVRGFVVPAYGDQADIPFARVNHNKYMVTDNIAYIGTSNWSGDYFIGTAGIGFVFNQTGMTNDTIRQQLANVFMRDWDSNYSFPLNQLQTTLLNGQ